jgi:DEAD/DEAH box helicase domain-containing protein
VPVRTDPVDLVDDLTGDPDYRGQLVHLERLPARPARTVALPEDLPPLVRSRLEARGITELWTHQAEALALARDGTHTVVATGTASGKSLCYLLPVFESLLDGSRRATALYFAPTKALAQDQLRTVRSFALTGVRAATYDGDTPTGERPRVRRAANLVLTNPDMLHQAILPNHERWAPFLGRLAYVVVDEAHTLRGVFGAHVAVVLRRLRRLARRYGAEPTFVLASATLGNPGELAGRLTGLPVEPVTGDGSPRGPLSFALWEPPLLDETTGLRRSTLVESAGWLAAGVEGGVRTLCFTRSRRGAELVATYARRRVAEVDRALAGRVRAYRAGYLAEERRQLEQGLVSGELLGVAATNALELGMDIGGLDAVVLNGFPGTIASMWQQAGRAGRRGGSSLAVLIGADDPMDAYLLHHPDDLFRRPHEGALVDPGNPYVLAPHLACAAYEAPLTEEDLALFGPGAAEAAAALEADGILRRRREGLRLVSGRSPAASIGLRNVGGPPVTIVEAGTGQLIGTVDYARAPATVHPGAVYLHQSESYKVLELDLDEAVTLVEPFSGGEYTQTRDDIDLEVLQELRRIELPRGALSLGRVAVTTQIIGYDRRRIGTGELLGSEELDMPPRRLITIAYWYTMNDQLLAAAKVTPAEVPGAAHAAEHAQIGLLPLFAMCDRWDIGGLSTAYHPDTGMATIFVYDGHPGGAGITERGFHVAPDHLTATRDTVATCPCESGCPSCVQSPKCGNGNHPLDKAGAVRLTDELLADLAVALGEAATLGRADPGREEGGDSVPAGAWVGRGKGDRRAGTEGDPGADEHEGDRKEVGRRADAGKGETPGPDEHEGDSRVGRSVGGHEGLGREEWLDPAGVDSVEAGIEDEGEAEAGGADRAPEGGRTSVGGDEGQAGLVDPGAGGTGGTGAAAGRPRGRTGTGGRARSA